MPDSTSQRPSLRQTAGFQTRLVREGQELSGVTTAKSKAIKNDTQIGKSLAEQRERDHRAFNKKYSLPPQYQQIEDAAYRQILQRQLGKIGDQKLLAAAQEMGVSGKLIQHFKTLQATSAKQQADQGSSSAARIHAAKQRLIHQILNNYQRRFANAPA